eukprot:14864258-Heterocapsa_arctica.AAC.1
MSLHGRRKLIYQCTLANQCPWCASVFADRKIAAKHANNSFFSGQCRVDYAWWPYDVAPITATECP